MRSLSYFNGKKVLITGGTAGIGLALYNRLKDQCEHIYLCGRNQEKLNKLCVGFDHVTPLIFDLLDKQKLQESLRTVTEVDIVIFNAGDCLYIDYPSFNAEAFEKTFQINFMSVVQSLEVLFPVLRKSKSPHITMISSSVAYLPIPRAEAYGSSKAAMNYLNESLYYSCQKDNIQFTSICPGFIETPLTDKNDFPMPFIMSSEKASKKITYAISKQKVEYHFPKKLTLYFKFLNALPYKIKKPLMKKFIRG
ncbi:MAG: SDR family NAD(P)-dependent oxidoreductase [Lentisphaeria bacterium]|nr:SDR family NAD(P)-dependent oxidoreductase [Lentisphaeria bacterium]